jgi:apolipoprotein N-acyltransferase
LNTAFTALISLALLFFGASRLEQEKKFLPSKQKVIVTAMQASLSSKIHKADSVAIVDKYVKLAAQAPSGSICVWPEWSMPMNFSGNQKALEYASALPAARKQDWILGGCDKDAQGRTFNAVCAITREGKVLPEIYHKRYLVPLGEYTPGWIKETPLGVMLYGLNKRYSDTSSGSKAVVYDLGNIKVAPVICFESAYPKLCAQSVRSGGELLVDSSDNSWFCRSILSDQMVSFAVMRAIENHRSFVFSTAFGPSTIVDSSGHILRQAPHEELAGISCSVPVEHDTTAYSMWCF